MDAARTYPVARASLPQGRQTIEFQTGNGSFAMVNIGSRFTIIPIRITGGTFYVGQSNTLGSDLPEIKAVPEPKKSVRKPSR